MPKNGKDFSKQEYGTDSYNRPGRGASAIGPSRAGWPGSALNKQSMFYTITSRQMNFEIFRLTDEICMQSR